MDRLWAFALSLSILLPIVAGIFRFQRLNDVFKAYFILLVVGLCNELVCFLFFYHSSNAVPTNIYFLCEHVLLSIQFYQWRKGKQKIYMYMMWVLIIAWCTEDILFERICTFSPYFQVAYSLFLILLAVNQLNWLIVNERGNIIKQPVFISCVAIIIFFSYKVITEIFYYYAPKNDIKNNIFVLESYVNVGYHLLLTIAILCIPPKISFIRQSR
jgi:hypothetical protein